MARNRKSASALFDAITLEGNLITPAMLARVAAHEAGAQSEADYSIPKGLTLRDEIARYFRIGQALFKELFASATPSTAATNNFAEALLRDVFGLSDLRRIGMRRLGDRSFPVTMEALAGRVPVVVVPPSDELDRASTHLHTEGRRRSAASSVQEWLNASEEGLWGFCCNGERLRLVRDNASLTRPAYVEANLRQLFEAEDFADFAALWLLIHVTRFGAIGAPIADCSLERWREAGSKEGESARERLRDGVEAALLALGNGYLSHPDNAALRERIGNNQLSLSDFFGQLLRLVYRLIFLLAAEDRGLLHPPGVSASVRKLYADGYSLGTLRDSAVRRSTWDQHHDRWEGLLITFGALAQGEPLLGLPALGGIFDAGVIPDLESIHISNRSLMEAIYRLAWLKDSASLMPVNWRDMETEELGSVYEGLLELTPRLTDNGRGFAFAEGAETKGNKRKTTGSYYTPDSLVQALLDSALDPVLDRIESGAEDAVAALLGVTVIDPACGSGHFLLAAARRIATRLAHARAEGVASAEDYRHALRDVSRSCIHGVDRNPMAVELTKVALWIETVEPGKPLGFLDANIRCGDSLLGVYDLEVLREGIPDAAYKSLSGDDQVTARDFERRNKAERTGQGGLRLLGGSGQLPAPPPLAGAARALRGLPEDDAQQIAEKRRQFTAAEHDTQRWNWRIAADAYVVAFLVPKTKQDCPSQATATIPTTEDVFELISGHTVYGPRVGRVQQLALTARAFHWPLEFPDVMAGGGFDIVVGNPPWDVMQLGEEEYFSQRVPEIAELSGADRKQAITRLETEQPAIYSAFIKDKRAFESINEFARESGRFELTAHGKINTYALFAELFSRLATSRGRAGLIVPTGIALADGTKLFFDNLITSGRLVSCFNFVEIRKWFPATDDRNPFGILTIGATQEAAKFAFFLSDVSELTDKRRVYDLTANDIANINPDTRTAPIFRATEDAVLTAKIYRTVAASERPSAWLDLKQNVFTSSNANDLDEFARVRESDIRKVSIFRGTMFHQYDPLFANYGPGGFEPVLSSQKGGLTEIRADKNVSHDYYERRVCSKEIRTSYHVAIRRIARSTDERTLIAAMLPEVGTDDTASIIVVDGTLAQECAAMANLNSLVLDYACAQKIGGTDIRKHNFLQLPIMGRSLYSDNDLEFIVPRVLELTYTSHSMAPFAHDLGYDGPPFTWDDERRALLRAELDAWYARAYGLSCEELRYILDPADVKGEDYPSETFRVLKNNEMKRYGEFRTRRLVLDAWDRLALGAAAGK